MRPAAHEPEDSLQPGLTEAITMSGFAGPQIEPGKPINRLQIAGTERGTPGLVGRGESRSTNRTNITFVL